MNSETIEQVDNFVYNDGGRKKAGFRGSTGDCVPRAIAIATGKPYKEVYDAMADGMKKMGKPRSARNGVNKKVYKDYLLKNGFEWVPTMKIGSGCRVHLKSDELPNGTIIARVSKHLSAVLDGVIHDTYDPSRNGTRCVYGYFKKTK